MSKKKGPTEYQKEIIKKAVLSVKELDDPEKGFINFSNIKEKHLYEIIVSFFNYHGVTTSHGKPFTKRRFRNLRDALRPHKEELLKLLEDDQLIKPNELNEDLEDNLGLEDTLAPYQSFIREAHGIRTADYYDDLEEYYLQQAGEQLTAEAAPPPRQLNKKEQKASVQELYRNELYRNLRTEDGSPLYEKRYYREHIRRFTDLEPII
jgi:hypothetical protein